jgi:3-oxoacyl-[acyl-carrier-protein] synthase III
MQYRKVCLESVGYALPEEIVTSAALEQRLRPLYERLRLPEGRLELMSGIRERRFWQPGTLPSSQSIVSGRRALEAAGVAPAAVGALLHASVCRDHLEPATACKVHHHLGLPSDCVVYDVSNACLGLLNGVVQIANMIELGQIRAGLVVGTEGSRQLVETTIESLNAATQLTRAQIKPAMASLTIGSASCAILLVEESLSRTGNRLRSAHFRAHTRFHDLCQSGQDEAVQSGMQPLMDTDAERLLQEGVAVGRENFQRFLAELGWDTTDIDKTFCHQVGTAHRKLMLETFGLRPEADFTTYEWLGNTGSVALPVTLGIGLERGVVAAGDQLAFLGIGSGINCLMLSAEWQRACVLGDPLGSSGPQENPVQVAVP